MNERVPDSRSRLSHDVSLPWFGDLRERRLVDERMDDPGIDPQHLERALQGIRRINVMSRAAASLWPVLRPLASEKPIRVLDLASGGGDVAVAIARKARRSNLPITVEGCDISATAVRVAQNVASHHGVEVRFFEHDAIRSGVPEGFDVIYSSLFFHHLSTPQVQHLLQNMANVAQTIIVNDLVRCRTGLLIAYAGCHTLSRSPVVHFDGPSSVAAAFTIPEFRAVADEAGLSNYSVSWRWPFRFLFTHTRASDS